MESTESLIKIDFQQYWFILKRRWLPVVASFWSVAGLAALHTFSQNPVYEAYGKLLIKTGDNVTSAITTEDSDSQKQIGGLSSVGRESDPLKTETEVIRSLPIAQRTIATLNLKDEEGAFLKSEEFLERLSLENIPGTDILQLSYQSTDPEEAAIAVNKIMSLYLENNVLANRTGAATAREFISRQLPKTEATVSQAEVALRKFKEENNVIALEQEAESAVGEIADVEAKITDAQANLVDANARSQALRSKLGMSSQEAVAASSLSQAPGVQKALEELQQVESQLAVEQTRYQAGHPQVVELRENRDALRAQLQGRVKQVLGTQKEPDGNLQNGELKQQLTADLVAAEAERLGLTEQVTTLSNVLATNGQRANVLPKLEQRQRELERQLTAAQSTYETLLKRMEEIRVEENRNVANARIVEQAMVPEKPVAPSKKINLAMGGLVGLLLGLGIALILEALDNSIKTVKQAREVFGYTLLGIIPNFGNKSSKVSSRDHGSEPSVPNLIVRDRPRSSISEAYRMLQANLKFLSSDKALKTLVVTSSVPREGKSTMSANLAAAIAQSGRRVLLVDADMRLPRQHHIWDLLNEAGLSDVLVGQAELRTVIKPVMDNLHVLSAGVVPPNPMALLDSERMAALIDNFADSYDFVIVDTPALCVAADAPILGRMADGVLLVVRPGVVDSASATAAKEVLERSGQNVLGQVLNGVISENEPYSYYYAKEGYVEEASRIYEKVTAVTRNNSGRS